MIKGQSLALIFRRGRPDFISDYLWGMRRFFLRSYSAYQRFSLSKEKSKGKPVERHKE
jgi:hypothetical protein